MKTIGIIGANGQVGSEVSLFLSQMPDVRVAPICRTAIGAMFLRRCGLEVRIGRVGGEDETRKLLGDLDLVADFSLPAGSSSEVQQQMQETLGSILRYAPARAPFAYLSSILAYGNPDFHQPLRDYKISRNAYGSTKRFAEKYITRLARANDRPAYLFRVGVVHGELQAATRQALHDVTQNADDIAYIPDAPSYTVFAYSIAEALVAAAYQKDDPGLYTLVSEPAWSWLDLHRYLLEKAGLRQRVMLLAADETRRRAQSAMSIPSALTGHKEVVKAYLGSRLPNLERQLRATYHSATTQFEIKTGVTARQYRPYLNNHTAFPGKRLRSLTDSRVTMHAATQALVRQLARAADTASMAPTA